jgi:hypothetical protein
MERKEIQTNHLLPFRPCFGLVANIGFDLFLGCYEYCHTYGSPLGIIKGSEVALRSEHGYMDREAYVTEVSRGARALFNTDSQRHHIYDLFECYRKWQHGRDAADRYVSHLRMFLF